MVAGSPSPPRASRAAAAAAAASPSRGTAGGAIITPTASSKTSSSSSGNGSTTKIKPLGPIDIVVVIVGLLLVIGSYARMDEAVWRLYHPRDASSLSVHDPAGRRLVDVLATHYDVDESSSSSSGGGGGGGSRLLGTRRSSLVNDPNFLSVRLGGPVSANSVTQTSRLAFDVDGA